MIGFIQLKLHFYVFIKQYKKVIIVSIYVVNNNNLLYPCCRMSKCKIWTMYFSISVSTQIINLINAFVIPLRERETSKFELHTVCTAY